MKITLIALSIINLSFFIGLMYSNKKLKTVSEGFAQLLLSYNALAEIIDLKEEAFKSEQDVHKENFIKFLSDSREWAFGYIESVQSGLKDFIEKVEPHLKYYNKYGVVIEGMIPPHDFALITITQEFEKLKLLLPEETDDRR